MDLQADAYQQIECLTAELLMHLKVVSLLTGAIDVDSMITCMVQAAQQTLPEKQSVASALWTTLFQGILGLRQNIKLSKE